MKSIQVRKIGVLSAAKVYAAVTGAIGVPISLLVGFIAIIGVIAGPGGDEAVGALVGALALIFIVPIFYAVMGFGVGALVAFVYNLVAGLIGGLTLEIEESASA